MFFFFECRIGLHILHGVHILHKHRKHDVMVYLFYMVSIQNRNDYAQGHQLVRCPNPIFCVHPSGGGFLVVANCVSVVVMCALM